jgi:hypothetical protein
MRPTAARSRALLPDRVVAAGTVAGETDFRSPEAWDDYPENEGRSCASATRAEPRRGAERATHARHTADIVPGAELVPWPDEGHLSLVKKIPELRIFVPAR